MANQTQDEVVVFLRAKLREAEAKIAAKRSDLQPFLDEERRLRFALRDYTAGAMGSGQMSDQELVEWIRGNASEGKPVRAPEVAAGIGLDTRGISRRLPRMVKDGLLKGTSESGYWAGAAA